MSAHPHDVNDHHDHHDDEDEVHVSMRDYTIGFVLAVILTVIPFALVMGGVFESSTTTALVILALGAVQWWCTWFTSCT